MRNPLHAILVAAMLASSPACVQTAHPDDVNLTARQKSALAGMRTLLIAQELIADSYTTLWSAPLRARAVQCDKPTAAETLECLGPFTPTAQDAIVRALEAYKESSRVAGEVLLVAAAEGEADFGGLVSTAVRSGLALLALIPGAEKVAQQLENLLG